MLLLKLKLKFIFFEREMDSPISIKEAHPYGRRRVGVNEYARLETLFTFSM